MYISSATVLAASNSFLTAPVLSQPAAFNGYDIISSESSGETLERWSSLIGIVTAIVGNILISFALNIQRYAHIRLHDERTRKKEKSRSASRSSSNGYGTTGADAQADSEGGETEGNAVLLKSSSSGVFRKCDNDGNQETTYLHSPYWWAGIALMTTGEVGNFLAYGFAPASIVSPLGVVALISNCVIAPFMLKEDFRFRDFWGVVIAIGGAVTVVLSAKQEEKKLGPHEIWEAISTLEFEIYMVVTIVCIIVLMWASPRYGSRTILIDLGLVGLFGGYTALSTKGVASMLSSTLFRAFTTPVTYVLLIVLIGTAVMQVKYVNKALQRFDSTQVIPVQFVMFTLSVIIGSAVLFRDFEKTTTESALKFIGGCLLTFFGVFLITAGRPSREDDDSDIDEDSEDEETIDLLSQDQVDGESVRNDARKHDSIRRRPRLIQDGDGARDEDNVVDSRRSSKVSFAEPSRPRSPRMYSNSSLPSIRLVPSAVSSEVVGEESPLLSNPWKSSSQELLAARHPGLQATLSSPVLPSEAQNPPDNPFTPPQATSRSNSQGNIHTHPNYQQSPAPPQADRPVTPVRNSFSRMMPGPFISPLSGGLSAVVADSLLRGLDSSSRIRGLRKLRRTKSGSQRLPHVSNEDLLGTSPLKYSDETEPYSKSLGTESDGAWLRRNRARSLSNTLGDLFKAKRPRSERTNTDGDEEAGPSGA